MNARTLKRAIFGSAVVMVGLTTTWVVAHAVNSRATPQQRQALRDATIAALEDAIAHGADGLGALPVDYIDDDSDFEEDDALMRGLWQRLTYGPASQQSVVHLLQETDAQKQREANYARSRMRLSESGGHAPTPGTTLQWTQLGPRSALSEWNGSYYDGLDSGRVATIRVDPTSPRTVYIGAIGGGIWKTPDITLTTPAWTPLTNTLGTMFIGSFDLDPVTPGVIHAGLGDYWEGNPGGVMVSSADGGTTWSEPKLLDTTLNGTVIHAVNTRTVRIDPNDHDNILVGSDVGLFRSTDGGATYEPIDLPNTALYGAVDLEGMFSIVYTGVSPTTGKSTFMASGNYACPGQYPPSFNQPSGSAFRLTCAGLATGQGNLGDIWSSDDGGATWTSARVAGRLPVTIELLGDPATPKPSDMGRINLTAVPGATSATTTVYGIGANETGSHTIAIIKTTDGGGSWTTIANGALTTPTNPTPGATRNDCMTLDIGHGQSQYDLTIAVDPGDTNNLLIGGNLCGARSIDGGTTWQMASDWLAFGGAEGRLSYVHADWHNSLITRVDGQPVALASSDGGIFSSFDLFSAARGADVHWFNGNVGLDTHLPYSVGSGDPTFGTSQYVLTGMQDNGTRMRVSATDRYLQTAMPMAWNQVQGGDGFGAAVSNTATGGNVTTWGVANGTRFFCRIGAGLECTRATRVVNDIEVRSYYPARPVLPQGDVNPGFAVRYWPLYDDAGSVITNSNLNLWKMTPIPGNQVVVTRLTTSPPPPGAGGYLGCGDNPAADPPPSPRSIRAGGPIASPFTYTVNGTPSRVYGLPLAGGCFAVVVDPGRADGVVSVVTARSVMQVGAEQVSNAGTITFPRDPAHLGGTDITQTYVVSSVSDFVAAPVTSPPAPISAATGHVFMTTDGGAHWTPLHGNGTGFDLPNVRVYIIRFDPSDPTDQTLWAGTDLGLYRSTDLGQTWARYGENLPMVRVQDVFLSLNGSLLRVALYGRGLWEIYPRSDGAGGLTGLGDFDRNGLIDFRDVGNLTNRLTLAPAATEIPIYDNEMNLTETGAATTLTDEDLDALLAKFGGVP